MKKIAYSAVLLLMPVLQGCGVENSESSRLDIVNGSRVSDDLSVERMGTVSLGGCTATIIARDLVLTAAHCVGRRAPTVTFNVPGGSSVRIRGERVISHPLWQQERLPNSDVAMIKLGRDIPPTHRVIPMLDSAELTNEGKPAVQAGYGNTRNGNGENTDSGRFLRRADTFITEHEITDTGGTISVENGSTISGGTAACSGDSGGPLYVLVEGRWFTAGVTSTAFFTSGPQGRGCSGGNQYASISGNTQWIIETARTLTGNRVSLFDPSDLLFN